MSKFSGGDHVECRVVLRPKVSQIEVQSFRGGRRIVSASLAAREDGCLSIELVVDPRVMTADHHNKVPLTIDPSVGQYLDTTA